MLSLRAAARLAGVAPSTLMRYLDAGDGPEGAIATPRASGRRSWRIPERAVFYWARARFGISLERVPVDGRA